MQETLKQLITYIRGIWRYHWQAMAVAWVIVLSGWVGVFFLMPNPYYTARAQLYIDTETVLRPLLQGLTVEVTPSEQLGLMTRQLMSRPNLEQVVQTIGLDSQGETPQPLDVVLEKLQSNISLKAERTSSDSKYLNYYAVSYTNRNPALAKQVVDELITVFIDNTLEEIQQDAARAKQFIEQQIGDYKEKLITSESRLREFKQKYIDVLPEKDKNYFQTLQDAQVAAVKVQLQIREAESRRGELQHQLQQTPAAQRVVSADGKPILTPLESRHLELQKQLDQLLLKFTEAHPNVIETRTSLAELERRLKNDTFDRPTKANPVYEQLQLKLAETEGELAGLRTKQEEYSQRLQALRQQMETLPLIEEDLQRLNRDYEMFRKNYSDLVARRQSMEISENVEQTAKTKFRIIEPPNVPVDTILSSVRQKQLLLITGVLAVGIGAGLGLAFVLSQIRPAVYSQQSLSELTELPVIGVVSRVSTTWARMRRSLDVAAFATTGLMMVIVYGGVLFLQRNDFDPTVLPIVGEVFKAGSEDI